jgi:hypothetical protein
MPDTTLLNHRDLFPAACILVDTTVLNAYDSVVPFNLHVSNLSEVCSTVEDGKGVCGGKGFWVASICEAYQGHPLSSGDPDSLHLGGTVTGTSCPYWYGGVTSGARGGCLTFIEAVRDNVAFWNAHGATLSIELQKQLLAAHEIGHLLGGRHSDDGQMDGGSLSQDARFSGYSLRRFMLLRDQGPSAP